MEDGIIEIDTPRGEALGFTGDKFVKHSYMWKSGNDIYINYIESKKKNQGQFRELITTLLNKGFTIKVTTPFPAMEYILKKYYFVKTMEYSETMEDNVEVWVLENGKR